MPEDISREQVQRLQADGAALVEVLPREEYEREHLAGAVSLPLDELSSASAQRTLGGQKTRAVVVYCQDVE
jgi:rhodanese-related sulfurtransferase